MSLIYLLASLPTLNPDAAPGITVESFREACRDQLPAATAATAAALLDGTPSRHPFVATWRGKEAALRNAVARERAKRKGKDAAPWLRPAPEGDSRIGSLVEDAFQQPDPLKRERDLDRIRWQVAEELQGFDPFTSRAVFVYAIKLALLSRWHALDAALGRQVFDRLARVPITFSSDE
jgi:hypothetical protein